MERQSPSITGNPDYEFMHSFTYKDGKILKPIAVLKSHSLLNLPKHAQPNPVQIVEITQVLVQVVGNIIIKITNLLNIGEVHSATVKQQSASDEDDHSILVNALHRLKQCEENLLNLASLARKHIATAVMEKTISTIRDKTTIADLAEGLEGLFHFVHPKASINNEQKQDHHSLACHILMGILKDVFEFLATEAFQYILHKAGMHGQPKDLQDYANQFQTIVVPNIIASWQNDDVFAALQTSGPNPLMITRVTQKLPAKFPINEQDYQKVMGKKDNISNAIAEKRLYIVDYQALEVQVPGTFPQQKYISPCIGLFAIKKHKKIRANKKDPLKAVAIQLGQQPGDCNPIFYPHSGDGWQLAKVHFQAANGNHHELISHLGLTHLLIELIAVSAYRMFKLDHPLMKLLSPHFQGTFFINNAAILELINPNGIVDRLLGGTIESDWLVTTNALSELNFDEHMLPNQLKTRGVEDVNLPLSYPYRDDALDIWNAINDWCNEYVDIYYTDGEAVQNDVPLQNWLLEVTASDGGGLKGIGQYENKQLGIYTKKYLSEVLTMIIFTASAQHAAVNFPQLDVMSFTPAMPLAAYAPPPINSQQAANPSLLETLPPLDQSLTQLLLGQVLGGVYFTRLGDYNRHQQGHYFANTDVQAALEVFRNKLGQVERRIGERNLTRPTYQPLMPSRIPQSINI